MLYAWLLILLPLASSAVLAFRGNRMSEAQIGRLAAGSVGLAFAVAVIFFVHVLSAAGYRGTVVPTVGWDGVLPQFGLQRVAPLVVEGPVWMAVGDLVIRMRLMADPLSCVMALVVTGVGSLIHLYARGYMHGDPHYPRFFALLNLFVASMMVLVLGENLAFMFAGWEGVGLCSYMLIGYYTEKHSATQAGKKAFIVNRIGDLGFLLGIFLCWQAFGTLSFSAIAQRAPLLYTAGSGILVALCLLLFIGATGKSAQFPLYVWLPDAMEGPTPVSALIHAATMVTAGVYLLARMSPVYELAPQALSVIAIVGLFTALLAGLLALVQNDIKRVLAYSTISQLGYMFLAAGVGAYAAAVFHLVTHAFFKALLFLGSGSVIHAMEHGLHAAGEHADPQDMRNMGGLRAKLPTTHLTMLLGSAAIAGVPLLSGFFSKDEIIFNVGLASGGMMAVALVVSFLTGFYMFRLMAKTFWQPTRLSPAAYEHVQESPPVMTVPLQVLAVLSVVGGLLNLPGETFVSRGLARFLDAVVVVGHAHPFSDELRGMVVSSIIALAAIGLAWVVYMITPGLAAGWARRFPGVYRFLSNRYYLDEFYRETIVKPGHQMAEWLAFKLDAGVIDGAVNGVAAAVAGLSRGARRYQPGFVRSYALWFTVGAVGAVGLLGLREWRGLVVVLLALLVASVLVVARPKDEA